jgi:hypothetical protein
MDSDAMVMVLTLRWMCLPLAVCGEREAVRRELRI